MELHQYPIHDIMVGLKSVPFARRPEPQQREIIQMKPTPALGGLVLDKKGGEDYDGLLKEYKGLKKELDEIKQAFYDCKRQLKVAEALQREYGCEIELLQNKESEETKKQNEKVAYLEESLYSARRTFSTKIHCLENDLLKKDDQICFLGAHIKDLENALTGHPDDSNKEINEILELKNENEQLLLDVYELKDIIKTFEKDKINLEESLSQCTEENIFLKEMLNAKREELEEHKELIRKLNDDQLCLQTELEMLKNKPLDQNTKGNSLFAEVNDRRVYLQETINKMKADYIQMKQERVKHLKEISHLKKENVTLCERWKSDIQEIGEDRRTIINALQDKINTLEATVNQLKKNDDEQIGGQFEFEVFQDLIDSKSKEIQELQQQVLCKASTQVQLTHALADINRELRYWRAEALMIRQKFDNCTEETTENFSQEATGIAETNQLKSCISWKQSLKGPKLPDKEMKIEEMVRINKVSGILKNKDIVRYDEHISKIIEKRDTEEDNKENLENQNDTFRTNMDQTLNTKKVAFSEDSEEFKVASQLVSRGKKVILSNPVYFGSSVNTNNQTEKLPPSCTETIFDSE